MPSRQLPSERPVILWQKQVPNGNNVEGRFQVTSSGQTYVYVVASTNPNVDAVYGLSQRNAPGDIHSPTTSPLGRTAGIYAHNTWKGELHLLVPRGRAFHGFQFNTANKQMPPAKAVQAFPALTFFKDSSDQTAGTYGIFYDLSIQLRHDGKDDQPRRVQPSLASYGGGDPSRFWDGSGIINQAWVIIRNTLSNRRTILTTLTLNPGQTLAADFKFMVPGLTCIPQALLVESFD